FRAYVLDTDQDIEEIHAELGLEVFGNWSAYEAGNTPPLETEDACVERNFVEFLASLAEFPKGEVFSSAAIKVLTACAKVFGLWSAHDKLFRSYGMEFRLFRRLERKLCEPDITRSFKDVDDFLETAQTILQRRKSRAGRALENHVEYLLKAAALP